MSESLRRKTLRHLQLAARAHGIAHAATPPHLVLYVNSSCNLGCEHCAVHANLNRPDDLRTSEIEKLSGELGMLEALHLTGGEPMLRQDLGKICGQFIQQNQLKHLSISTSGYHITLATRAIEQILAYPGFERLTVELSIDGTAEYHNRFRGDSHSFHNAIQTYYGLAALARRDARLRLRVVSTVTRDNMAEIERLSHYLYDRCPQLERHALTPLCGERRRASLRAPEVAPFLSLEQRIDTLWADRVHNLTRRMAEPVLSWARAQALTWREQVVPCKAGVLSAVVHANGDVSVCDTDSAHPRLGNLRESSFRELWSAPQTQKARAMIRSKQCACANERCLAPSVLYQPTELARARIKQTLRPKLRVLPTETPLAYACVRQEAEPSGSAERRHLGSIQLNDN